ncbi:MAG: M48 family metallopeptidase [Paracoccaceae bacterium]
MSRLLPILLALAWAFVMIRYSVWQTSRMLAAKSRPLEDPEILRVTRALARAQGLDHIAVYLFDIEAVNGLAAPDGRIYLTRGFYNRFRAGAVSADELASVIAHELGHVALGHTRKRMIDVTGQNALFIALTALFARFLPIIGIWIANAISTALAARLSRSDEYAADEYASALLIKAGIGTGPQKRLFEKLEALTGGHGAAVPAWLRSHPRAADRIAAIEAHEARWNG